VTSRLRHLEPGDLLTISEVLEVVPVSRSWLHERIRRGDLPALRMAAKIVVHREDLALFLEAHKLTAQRPNAGTPRIDVDSIIRGIHREAS
jgi:Helix-turn-helix domain